MLRYLLLVAALVIAFSASWSQTRDDRNAQPSAARPFLQPVQTQQKGEISVAQILRDVVGRQIWVSELSSASEQLDWTFAADEPKRVDVIEQQMSATTAALVVHMFTSGAPGSDDEDVQLAGRLKLNYEWDGRRWMLRRIDNLSFRYSLRISI